MGSLDAIHYIRCNKCNGLFSDVNDAEAHSTLCTSDIVTTDCELVACKKENYIKYVLPNFTKKKFTQVVYRYTPKSKVTKNAKRVCDVPDSISTTEPAIVNQENVERPDEAAMPTTRRYGLRKGASEALHSRISSMKHLLGMRIKPESHSSAKIVDISVTNLDNASPPKTPPLAVNKLETTTNIIESPNLGSEPPHTPQQTTPKEPAQENAVLHDDEVGENIVDATPTDNGDCTDEAPVTTSATTTTTRLRTRSSRKLRDHKLMTSLLNRVAMEVHESQSAEEGKTAWVLPTIEHTNSHVMKEEQDMEEESSVEKELEQVASTEENAGSDGNVQEPDVRVSSRLKQKKKKKAMAGLKATVDWPKADTQGVYHCTLCKYKTSKQGMFVRHMGAHNNGQMYTCEFCDAKFMYRRLYKQHLGIHKGFQCETCTKMFSRRHDLSRHVETIHTGLKKYVCAVCGYGCCHHHMLRDHMRKHTSDRYRCTEPGCQFATIYRRALLHHLSTVHNKEKHIVCSLCGYRTNDNCAFSKHRRTHSDEKLFNCGLCDYKAHSMSYVTTHQATHNQDMMYMCDQCDYSSVRPTGIRSHMMKHIGVKPWQCPNCEYSSTTRHKVTRHVSMRHKGTSGAGGQPIRRNITIKFDVNAFKVKRKKEMGGEESEQEQQQLASTVEANTMLGYKYMVIEVIDETGTALSSGLVGEEVVVQDEQVVQAEPDDDSLDSNTAPDFVVPAHSLANHTDCSPTPATSIESDPSPLCLYKCALCQFTHPVLEMVQEHMTSLHSDFIGIEVIDVTTAEAETCEVIEAEASVIQVREQGEEEVSLEIALETVQEEGCVYHGEVESVQREEEPQGIVGDNVEMATLVAHPRQTVTMQDDAVSTAVESILHLQHIPHKT